MFSLFCDFIILQISYTISSRLSFVSHSNIQSASSHTRLKMSNSTDVNSTIDTNADANSISTEAFFYLFLFLGIPAVILTLLLFYYFFCLPELREHHYEHQMIIYLTTVAFLTNAIDIPMLLPYLKNHHYILRMAHPNVFCAFWISYDYAVCSSNVWMMALFSFERYLLIFFKQTAMKSKQRRLFLYYILVAGVFLSIFCWYISLVVLYPCSQYQFDYTQILCGLPCYIHEGSAVLRNLDWILAGILPVFLTVLFTLALILHVLYQKQKIGRHLMHRDTLKRTRKMFLQLLPIMATLLLFGTPVIIVGLIGIANPWYGTIPYSYASILFYFLPLFIPFAIFSKQKLIRRRLLTCLTGRLWNRTVPATMMPMTMRTMNVQMNRETHPHIISTA